MEADRKYTWTANSFRLAFFVLNWNWSWTITLKSRLYLIQNWTVFSLPSCKVSLGTALESWHPPVSACIACAVLAAAWQHCVAVFSPALLLGMSSCTALSCFGDPCMDQCRTHLTHALGGSGLCCTLLLKRLQREGDGNLAVQTHY